MTERVKIPARRVVLEAPERARWELAAMAGRLRSLEVKLAEEQANAEEMRRERDRERRRLERLQHSESYRLGYGLVSLVKDPVHTVPRIARAVLRRLRGRHAAGVAGVRKVPVAAQRPPAHLYVAIGLDTVAVREFVLTLQQRLLVNPDHRPIVVTDCPSFALLRDLGVLLEYLPDRATWEKHRPDRPWDDLLSQRLTRLYRDHDTARTIMVDRAQLPTLADLLR
ncbi:hypothetical protein [Paractinoplanes durhamensis]|uniref:Uncharacterized protein n=1 Tax=Paractinoplanes durhamensis TaxID=113563 RepID=A0ABQ3YMX3_9ACTN|nr:hypothetical protein [Actinoplanes durhamensis]GID98930.1 hypothetical protein Adu01nite_02810 [Actinoplanes durhamensis]